MGEQRKEREKNPNNFGCDKLIPLAQHYCKARPGPLVQRKLVSKEYFYTL